MLEMFLMLKSWIKNQRGNVAVSFALASVALIGVGGGVIDYASTSSTTSHLQGIADEAVLVAVNELKLSGSQASHTAVVTTVAQRYVKRNLNKSLSNTKLDVKVSPKDGIVDLTLSGDVETKFLGLLGLPATQKIITSARGQVLGGLPLCVLSLDETIGKALSASNTAQLTATGCSVHANSTDAQAIEAWGQAVLATGLTCSAGGAVGGTSNYQPSAIQDCPPIPNPLATRTPPTVPTCNHSNKKITNGNHVLNPGRYCGGLKITGNASVEFNPGIYFIDSGKFEITGNASAEGEHVGFFFHGPNAFFGFHGQAEVNFSAPSSGDMAGLLFFESPEQTISYVHEITSVNTKKLVGTIYLPKSELRVSITATGGSKVAQESAFTVIVARQVTLNGKSNLVLNTDFAATDVPVPPSIKRLSGRVVISK